MFPPLLSKLTLMTCLKPGEFGGNETVCLFEAESYKPKQLLLYLLEHSDWNPEPPYKKHNFPETAVLVRSCVDATIHSPAQSLAGSQPVNESLLAPARLYHRVSAASVSPTANAGETYSRPSEPLWHPLTQGIESKRKWLF